MKIPPAKTQDEREWLKPRSSKVKKRTTKKKSPAKIFSKKGAKHNISNLDNLGARSAFENEEQEEEDDDEVDIHLEATNVLRDRVRQLFQQSESDEKGTTQKEVVAACAAFHGRSMTLLENGKWHHRCMTKEAQLDLHQMFGGAQMRIQETRAEKPNGGILADDMGLGKTITCLLNIVDSRQIPGIDKTDVTLIIAPTHLVDHWYAEIEKFCDEKAIGRVLLYTSVSKPGCKEKDLHKEFRKHRVVITTYSYIRKSYPNKPEPKFSMPEDIQMKQQYDRDFEAAKGLFHTFHWHRVILEEGQEIKNYTTHGAKACTALQATYRWVVSATPCQDRAEEMYSYFVFLKVPGTTGLKEFKAQYFKNNKPEVLKQVLGGFTIRRESSNKLLGRTLQKLPPQHTETIELDHNPRSGRSVKKQIAMAMGEAEKDERLGIKVDGRKLKELILSLLLVLRQAITHFLLIAPLICSKLKPQLLEDLVKETLPSSSTSRTDPILLNIEVKEMINCLKKVAKSKKKKSSTRPKKIYYGMEWIGETSEMLYPTKTAAIVLQIRKWLDGDKAEKKDGGKIIIFTQFRDYIGILAQICTTNKWGYRTLHGKMSIQARGKAITEWEEESKIHILIATMKTGGTGLNLTAASRAIIADLWWNSAVEEQAFARVRRRGQTRPMHFVRFAINGTHDERILALQKRKSDGINAVLSGTRVNNTSFVSELLSLVGLDNVDASEFDDAEILNWNAQKDAMVEESGDEEEDDDNDSSDSGDSDESDEEAEEEHTHVKEENDDHNDEENQAAKEQKAEAGEDMTTE